MAFHEPERRRTSDVCLRLFIGDDIRFILSHRLANNHPDVVNEYRNLQRSPPELLISLASNFRSPALVDIFQELRTAIRGTRTISEVVHRFLLSIHGTEITSFYRTSNPSPWATSRF